VVADRLDTSFDSAVFIEGGSFDIGNVELGSDFLQATNNALCFGDNYTIETGLSTDQFNFTWSYNGDVIPNQTGPNLTITEQGVYGVITQYINTTCSASDFITIEYYGQIVSGTPINLTECGINGFAEFNLNENNIPTFGNLDQTLHNIAYYLSVEDAEAEINPLPILYTNVVANLQTIYVRVENIVSGCFITSQFDLIVTPIVVPTFTIVSQICQNDVAPILPAQSVEGISGTWSPSVVSNLQTTTYTFTADSGECVALVEQLITVLPLVTTTFLSPAPICSGDIATELPTTSNNGIIGSWSPATVDNTQTVTYTFTPNEGQCASTTTLVVEVLQNCAFGSYANAVWLTNCSTSNFFNTVGSGTDIIGPVANVFPNTELGTYLQNSNTLILRGAEVKTFKTTTANVCSARFNYRIYPQAGTPGAFIYLSLMIVMLEVSHLAVLVLTETKNGKKF
jgi:hypothetical protein